MKSNGYVPLLNILQKFITKPQSMSMWPYKPFRISVDHVTIFNSSPMQLLRWSSWLETAVDCCYIELRFNMTGLLDPTLKCIDKFRLRQGSIPSAIYMFKVSKKHTRTTCQIYSKLVIKTPQRHLVLLLLTLNIFRTLFCC